MMEEVRARLEGEADPEGCIRAWSAQQVALLEQVRRARGLLPKVMIPEGLLVLISELCCSQGVASLRADLVKNKAARALAALRGRERVEPDDISEAATLVLPHRRRTKPFEQPGLDEEQLQRLMEKAKSSAPDQPSEPDGPPSGRRAAGPDNSGDAKRDSPTGNGRNVG